MVDAQPRSDLLNAAIAYRAEGLCALPAIRTEKRPAIGSWKAYQARLPTQKETESWFSADHDSICLITGAVSGNLELIDFDHGGELFAAWSEAIPPALFAKLVIETSQSGGKHVIYRCESEVGGSTKLAQRQTGDEVETLIETRGEGGLFLCAPTAGYELLRGDLALPTRLTEEERETLLLAAWELNEFWHQASEDRPRCDDTSHAETLRPGDDFSARGDLGALLRSHGWRAGGVCADGNQHWTRPGKKHGTSATLRDGVFYVFSSSAHPFEAGQAYSPFAVYALLEHGGDFDCAAKALAAEGYGESALDDIEIGSGVDLSGILESENEPSQQTNDPGPFPSSLLHVPGFIDQVIEYNLQSATRPQPVLALSGAIALQAVLAARKVRDLRGNRTNLYLVSVADSGAGKEHARKVCKQILYLSGLSYLEANDEIASDAGLISATEPEPGCMFQIDEFGRFLRTIGDPKRAPHLYNALGVFMKLYSSADTTFKGKAYGDRKRNKVIDQPCVILHGTSVPEHFYESLTTASMNDGFVGRMLVFESPDMPARQRVPQGIPPPAIVEAAQWWGDFEPSGNLRREHPDPKIIESTAAADRAFDDFADRVDVELQKRDSGSSLWARAEEKACRLALVYACSENREAPVININAARWACQLAEYLTLRLLFLANHWVSDGTFDARQKKVLRVIRDMGGEIAQRDLSRKTQWLSQRERTEIIDNLLETGQLVRRNEATRTKPKTVYRTT